MLALKIAVSLVALAILGGHVIWPSLRIDAISLGLLIVALLPWASSLIESAKFPGGWEIKFRDLKKASDKIESAQGAWFKKGVEVLQPKEWVKRRSSPRCGRCKSCTCRPADRDRKATSCTCGPARDQGFDAADTLVSETLSPRDLD
jgi:hypothetical protein